MIVPMPASMSINHFFLPEVVFFGAPVGSHLANLSRVARIETISVSANLDFLPLSTYHLTRSPVPVRIRHEYVFLLHSLQLA